MQFEIREALAQRDFRRAVGLVFASEGSSVERNEEAILVGSSVANAREWRLLMCLIARVARSREKWESRTLSILLPLLPDNDENFVGFKRRVANWIDNSIRHGQETFAI